MKLLEPYTFNKGRITIFKRQGALKGTWHYRLKIRGRAKNIIRSAKTPDREEAIRIAETEYEDNSYLVRHGREVSTDMKFDRLWTTFCSAHQVQQSSVHRRRHYEGNGTRYFVPFFGDKRVSAISDSVVDDYWRWRLEFWAKHSDAPPNAKLLPSNKTLQMEAQMLKQVFRWALRKGYLHRELLVVAPQSGEKHSRMTLAKNMGTSVQMLERHYSHVQPRQSAHALGKKKKAGKLGYELTVPDPYLEDCGFLSLPRALESAHEIEGNIVNIECAIAAARFGEESAETRRASDKYLRFLEYKCEQSLEEMRFFSKIAFRPRPAQDL